MQGSKPSDKLLETFAEKLLEAITHGDLHVEDWSPEKDAKIKVCIPLGLPSWLMLTETLQLNFGPSSKQPLHMPLIEISSSEAASHATNVFLDVSQCDSCGCENGD